MDWNVIKIKSTLEQKLSAAKGSVYFPCLGARCVRQSPSHMHTCLHHRNGFLQTLERGCLFLRSETLGYRWDRRLAHVPAGRDELRHGIKVDL